VSLSLSICVNPTHATSLTHPSAPLKEALSRDSQERLARGSPLRILDSKDERDIDLLKSAPCLSDFLSQDSLSHLDHVKRCLEAADVAYTVDPRLVRGLDYYGHTAFEFVVPDSGRQSAVLAGGRYDLGETLGKTSLPSVGWAMGVDRLIDILPVGVVQPTTPVRVLMPHTESLVAQRELEATVIGVLEELRNAGIPAIADPSDLRISKLLFRAHRDGCRAVVILGETELEKGTVLVKDLESRSETEVTRGVDMVVAVLNCLRSDCNADTNQ